MCMPDAVKARANVSCTVLDAQNIFLQVLT